MEVFLPRSLDEALEMKVEHPEAVPIAGGTDLMVHLNFDWLRPEAMMDISRLGELRQWRREDGELFLGAGVTYTRILNELADQPAWAQAARTVGSPQIRNRGTVGGNLGTASPAGDALPVLAALDASVILTSAGDGQRWLPWDKFMVGVKKTTLRPDELILGCRWKAIRGTGSYSKIGTRNAMVISMAGLCLILDEETRTVRVALGSVAPTIVRATEAEAFAAGALSSAGAWEDPEASVPQGVFADFGQMVADATSPIDDVRGTAAYRRHAVSILARRAMAWALQDRRTARAG